jgi:GLPGLI family protein
MKNSKLFTVLLLSLTVVKTTSAQSSEGVITYEIKINMHRNIPADKEAMKEMVPEFRTHLDQLFFNATESLYRPVEEEPEEDLDNGQGMRMRILRPKNEIYTNQQSYQKITLHYFMGKQYLIEDSLRMRAWKLGTEVREVKGYVCRNASFFDEESQQNIIAWYTDKFRPFLGPESFNNLPGTVLLVDINDGERVIEAKTVVLRTLTKDEMYIPTAKTKITEQEYRKMVSEQRERMRRNGGNVIIRN